MFRTLRTPLSTLALAALSLCAATSSHALGLGDLVGGINASAGSAAPVDPDSFIKSAAGAEKLMGNSLQLLSRSLLSKEKSAQFDAAITSATKLTDPGERQAKTLEAQKDAVAALNEQTSSDSLKADIDKLNTAQRAQLGASAFNFTLALLQDKALIDQSKSIIASMSGNPMQLAKLAPIRDTATSLTNQISIGSQIAGKMPDIFKAVGVKAPTSKDDKPKQVTTGDKGD
jgi:hypothetical protein